MTKQKHFYLIRGLVRERGHWGKFIQYLSTTFPHARITTLDLPGAGVYFESSSPFTIKGIVEKMRLDYVSSKQDSEEAIVVAISLGGMIVVEWLKHFPQDFNRVTLINTSFGGLSPVHERLRPRAFIHLSKVFMLKGRQKESHILRLISNNEEVFEETLDLWDEIQKKRPVSLPNTVKQLFAGATFKVGRFTPPVPMQILAATQDRMVSVECSRAIAKKWELPLEEHPTGGHDLTVDSPEWVAKKIKEFSDSLESSATRDLTS